MSRSRLIKVTQIIIIVILTSSISGNDGMIISMVNGLSPRTGNDTVSGETIRPLWIPGEKFIIKTYVFYFTYHNVPILKIILYQWFLKFDLNVISIYTPKGLLNLF